MSEEITQKSNVDNREDEISLIDLISVLLKYRKLIIIGTLVVTLLVGIWLFILPKIFPSMNNQTFTVAYDVVVTDIPVSIKSKLFETNIGSKNKNNILSLSVDCMTKPSFFAQIYKNYYVFSDDAKEMDVFTYNKYINDLFSNGDITVKESLLGNSIEIVLKIKEEKLEVANDFINSLVSLTNNELEEIYFPKIDQVKENVELSMQMIRQSFSIVNDMSSFQALQEIFNDIDGFKSSYTSFIKLIEDPFVIPEAQGRLIKLVIACFASFFIFVFISFFLNAIENIKADPKAYKIISDAWRAGK